VPLGVRQLHAVADIHLCLLATESTDNPKTGAMSQNPSMPRFTPKQGQYLTFIHAYTCVLGRPPAEADMRRFFHGTPPSVHQMVLSLERAGLIQRTPGAARSIKLLLPPESLPVLHRPDANPS
jgi:DNA-binding MarR family transcriptional regulator